MNSGTTSNTRLHGHRLAAARAIWAVLVVLTLALFCVGMTARLSQLFTLCAEGECALTQLTYIEAQALQQRGISLPVYVLYFVTLEAGFALVFALIGLLIAWRKSDDWLALFTSLTLVTFGAIVPPPLRTLDTGALGLRLAAHSIQALGWSSFFTFLYLFPNGRFVPSWTRWRPALFALWAVAWLIVPGANLFNWPLPLALAIMLVWFVSGVTAQVYRYLCVSSPAQRQQTKWVVSGFALATLGIASGVALFLVPTWMAPLLNQPSFGRVLYHMVAITVFSVAQLAIPVSIGTAILRYHLWDIDILIRRTLVYTALTAALAIIYFGSVLLLQNAFTLMGGGQSSIAIALSTLAIAILFAPLRGRVQDVIDRRFYRHKYDATQALAVFSASLLEETDLDQLTQRLIALVQETVQPAQVSLWLMPTAEGNQGAKPEI